jgi:hypothetical protein
MNIHHIGDNLAQKVVSVLESVQLQHRVIAVTTDNAANNLIMMDAITHKLQKDLQSPRIVEILQDSAIADVVNSQVHIPCLAHVLQLAVKELFTFLKVEATNDEIEMVWDASDQYIHSEGFAATLEKVYKSNLS